MILAEALKEIGVEHLQIDIDERINCFNLSSMWGKGSTIINFMKNVSLPPPQENTLNKNSIEIFINQAYTSGLTGPVEFDTNGVRSNVGIDVMYLDAKGLNKLGTFKPSTLPRLTFEPRIDDHVDNDDLPIEEKFFRVAIAMVSARFVLLFIYFGGITLRWTISRFPRTLC